MLGEYSLFALTGVLAGTMAGLLGLGGGVIVVPGLAAIFIFYHFPQTAVMHMAAATSLAAMVFTASSSVYSHHRRGAVLWPVFKRFLPGAIIGTVLGAIFASVLTTQLLKIIFGIFLLLIAIKMFLLIKPKGSRRLPGKLGTTTVASAIGIKSGLLGIGGGAVMVPFLTWCNVTIRQASGTSAAIGLPIAITGTITTMITGWGLSGLPPLTIGYVYWPAAITVASTSMLSVFLGAKLSLWLPARKIRRVFAVVLVLAAFNLFR